MEVSFVKMHGLGNDFIFIDDMSETIELTEEQVRWLCDRHVGIGADGVILVRPPRHQDCAAFMYYINSDGTLAQMCGNGVRCFAKYIVDHDYVDTGEKSLIVDTLAGPRSISFTTDDQGKLLTATVDMGTPVFDPDKIPVNVDAGSLCSPEASDHIELEIGSPWGDFTFTCLSMGNPHAVCFIDDWTCVPDDLFEGSHGKSLSSFKIDLPGAFFESHAAFPEKANIEFAVVEADRIDMRVFERGCGETLACGTGACATSVAAALTQRATRKNTIALRGGDLEIDWRADNHVMMTGAAAESFNGVVVIPKRPTSA